MRLNPLYTLRFDYPQSWGVEIKGEGGVEEQLLLFAEGSVQGRINGHFRGANFPRRRTDRTALTDFRGVIETDDKATILLDCRGFGRRHTPDYDQISPGGRQWVATVFHVSDSDRYGWLNDTVCVGTGQVRPKKVKDPANPSDLVLEVSELVWEPVAD